MKKTRILGFVVLVIALAVIVTGVVGERLSLYGNPELYRGSAALKDKLNAALEEEALIAAHAQAAEKTAVSVSKKADNAVKAADGAAQEIQAAIDAMDGLDAALAKGETGDTTLDELLRVTALLEAGRITADAAVGKIEGLNSQLDGYLATASDAQAALRALADQSVLALYARQADAAQAALLAAEDKLIDARASMAALCEAIGKEVAFTVPEKTAESAPDTQEACRASAERALATAQALQADAAQAVADAAECQAAANEVRARDGMSVEGRFLILISRSRIGVFFTALLLLILAAVLIFFAPKFVYAWKKYPAFSVAVVLAVLLAVQAYALGFSFATVGQWLSYWFTNALNVMRSNSSVGMIALGMTFVIITGGIDLAVGSTLAGVATVVMVLMDISANGRLTASGVTGLPNYLIACGAGVLTGAAIGAFNGLGITKGRIPPFIITLGVMNIVRSVAQYFTKNFKTEVPKEFQVLANGEIAGQMILPILYWLILAVIMYVISKHTAFGRYIYAVGSNERTAKLSGINTNRVKMKVYVLMGLIVAAAAITQVARLRGVDVASAGSGYEMNAIAAVVVGGTSMAGGRGSIAGTMLGVLIIGIMNNLLVLLGIDAFLANAFTGAIIIVAVLMQRKDKN